ncbi:hypothetical protein BC937DRAFT_89249 [Endogone sp. FLAS-F59071]|nr:hypothetical protein BC937DRAFT_89249 [Endogone sp. FLAS-F59071]|eukprot:RUS18007.1 hypothetical protein BC937DRAFT_89249 [Endogone sp. FLAS-F59071]
MRLDVPSLRSLRDKRIILASGSLRRKEILANLMFRHHHQGLDFTVIPSTFPETLDKSTFAHPRDYVSETALRKGLEVFERLMVRRNTNTYTYKYVRTHYSSILHGKNICKHINHLLKIITAHRSCRSRHRRRHHRRARIDDPGEAARSRGRPAHAPIASWPVALGTHGRSDGAARPPRILADQGGGGGYGGGVR